MSGRKEAVQLHRKAGNRRTVQRAAGPVERMLGKLLALWLAVDFDLFLWPQHQPTFPHAGDGVGAEFGAVVIVAAHTNLDHQFGGVGVVGRVVIDGTADDRKVRLRLRIAAEDRLLRLNVQARGQDALKQFQEPHKEEPVEGRLGHFVEDLAVEQFGLLGDEAQVAQRMIGFDAERPDLRTTDDWFRCFNYRHGVKVILPGVAAQVQLIVQLIEFASWRARMYAARLERLGLHMGICFLRVHL